MPFVRRFRSVPTETVIQEIEGPVIVDLPPPGVVTGAGSGTVFRVYFLQIGALSVVGIALGLALGAVLPFPFAPVISSMLPLNVAGSIYPSPLF